MVLWLCTMFQKIIYEHSLFSSVSFWFCTRAEQLAIVQFLNFVPTFVDASWKEGWPRRVTASERTSHCCGPSLPHSVMLAVIRTVFQPMWPSHLLATNLPFKVLTTRVRISAWHMQNTEQKKQNRKIGRLIYLDLNKDKCMGKK